MFSLATNDQNLIGQTANIILVGAIEGGNTGEVTLNMEFKQCAYMNDMCKSCSIYTLNQSSTTLTEEQKEYLLQYSEGCTQCFPQYNGVLTMT
jgi:hypothetical protein